MTVGRGIKAFLGFGGETTYGTAGTIDLWLPIISETLGLRKPTFRTEVLGEGFHPAVYFGPGRVDGDVVMDGVYAGGIELLLHALLGTYSFQSGVPVANTYTHTFSFNPSTNSFPVGITADVERGIGGAKGCRYTGLHVTRLVVEFQPNQVVRYSFGFLGQNEALATIAAATMPTHRPILPTHLATLTFGGSAMAILSGRLEINVPRKADRERYGQDNVAEPVIVGRPECQASFTCEYSDVTNEDSHAIYALYRGETTLASVSLTHQGDIITGATPYSAVYSLGTSYVTGETPSVQGPDINQITLNVQSCATPSIVLVNNQASQVT